MSAKRTPPADSAHATGRAPVALITGAASGIGAAIAARLNQAGYHIFATDIDTDALAARSGKSKSVIFHALDVSVETEWDEALRSAQQVFGHIDAIIHSAAVHWPGTLDQHSSKELDATMLVNVGGSLHAMKSAAKLGHTRPITLVIIGSMASFVPLPGQAAYVASKHAVRAATYAFAMEKPAGVSIRLVHPAATATPMLFRQTTDESSALSFAEPLLQPEDVADATLRALRGGRFEVLVPGGFKGFAARIVGVFPGLLKKVLASQHARGLKRMRHLTRD